MKTLSVVIPVYNESKTIRQLLDRVNDVDVSVGKQIIIVNDGSTDGSRDVIVRWLAEHSDVDAVLSNQENAGKGAAVRAGIQRSTGDVVIIQDADLEYDPNDYRACVQPILDGQCKVVYGSRELSVENRRYSHATFYAGGLLVTNWMNLLYESDLTDEPTCYKTFDGDLIRSISIRGDGFEWEPEVTGKLLRLGYEIREVPIRYSPRKSNEGKKIKWRDGLNALWTVAWWRVASLRGDKDVVAKLSEADGRRLERRNRAARAITLIFAIALIVRFLMIIPGLSEPEKTFIRTDSPSYIQPALALLKRGAFLENPDGDRPSTKRPPGFSVFLAGVFAINGGGLRLPVGLLCLISASMCFPIFLVGRRLAGARVGLLAALLYAFNITSIGVAPLLISDTLFTLFVAWQLYFFSRFVFSPRLTYLLLAVGLAAVSALVRPISMLWIVPAVFLVMIFSGLSLRRRFAFSLAAFVIFAIILAPWMVRNYRLGAGFRLDTNIGDTLLYHNCAVLKSLETNQKPSEIRERFRREMSEEFDRHPEKYAFMGPRIAHMTDRAMRMIKTRPLRYAFLHFRPQVLIPDAASFFEVLGFTKTGRGTFDVLNKQGVTVAVRHYFSGKLWLIIPIIPLLLVVGGTYLGCAGQLVVWVFQRKWFMLFFFLAFVEYFLFLPGPITMPRYHLPALPLMTVMAAMFLVRAGHWLKAGHGFGFSSRHRNTPS